MNCSIRIQLLFEFKGRSLVFDLSSAYFMGPICLNSPSSPMEFNYGNETAARISRIWRLARNLVTTGKLYSSEGWLLIMYSVAQRYSPILRIPHKSLRRVETCYSVTYQISNKLPKQSWILTCRSITYDESVLQQVCTRRSINNNSECNSGTLWRQRYRSTLDQVLDCCLTAPSHYLSQC